MDFSDLVAFVDREARIVTNPVFGRIPDIVKPPSGQRSSGGKTALKRPENLSFITQVDGRGCPPSEMVLPDTSEPSAHDYGEQSLQSREAQAPCNYPVTSRERRQCVCCNSNHALEDCLPLRWKPRIQFLASNKLFFGYLSNQHISRFCPQRKTCKIANCSRKHPSILHTSPRERHTADVGVGTEDRELKHLTFSTGRRQPEVKFTSDPRFPPTESTFATLRRLCFAYFDVACKT